MQRSQRLAGTRARTAGAVPRKLRVARGLFSPLPRPFLRARALASLVAAAQRSERYTAPSGERCRAGSLWGGRMEAESGQKVFFRLAIGPLSAPAPMQVSTPRLRGVRGIAHLLTSAAGLARCGAGAWRPSMDKRTTFTSSSALSAPPSLHAPRLTASTCLRVPTSAPRSVLGQHASAGSTCPVQSAKLRVNGAFRLSPRPPHLYWPWQATCTYLACGAPAWCT